MTYSEAKHRIIRMLPDNFLKEDGNREALYMMEELFNKETQHGYWLIPSTGKLWRKGYHGKCSVCGYTYSYNINKMPKRCDNCDTKMLVAQKFMTDYKENNYENK